MLGSIGRDGWFEIIECCHIFKIGLGIALRKHRNIFPELSRRAHNFIVNIGDIARVLNIRVEAQ